MAWEQAKQFLKRKARPLERALYELEFKGGSRDRALAELARYRNTDGGFGRGLEPDIRADASTVYATTVALQTLSEIGEGANHPLVRGAMEYLIRTYDKERDGWSIVTREIENAPRAPWWQYGAFDGTWGNPNAEIAGYLNEYVEAVPQELVQHVTDKAIEYINVGCKLDNMFELFCYIRFSQRIPASKQALIADKLDEMADRCVVADPSKREGYVPVPLDIVTSPRSPFYDKYAEVIPGDLDRLWEDQREDGAWHPAWQWGQHDETWAQAKEEWKGILTLDRLKKLKVFGRI